MAKRFIDSGIFNDSWFIDLSVDQKILYIYLFTNCDFAGIIDFNKSLATVQTGIKDLANSFETLSEGFGNRLQRLTEGSNYYFLPKFIKNQYPNGLNPNVKATASVIKRLSDFGLLDQNNSLIEHTNQTLTKGLTNPLVRVQDKDKDIDKNMDKDKEKQGEILNFSETDIFKAVVLFFSLSETRNPNDLFLLNRFLNLRKTRGNLDVFEKQFAAYCEYKRISKQAVHSFKSFVGDLVEDNGGWQLRDWINELAKQGSSSGVIVNKLDRNQIFDR